MYMFNLKVLHMIRFVRYYFTLCLFLNITLINAQQLVEKPEDVLHEVVNTPYAFFDITKYPSAMDIVDVFSDGGKPDFKTMKVGEKFRVLGLDSIKYTWPRYVKILREKTGKIGWIITKVIYKRECFLPMFPNTHKELIPSILKHELAYGMNADDIFLTNNTPVNEDMEQTLDSNYSIWKDGPFKEMIFYKGELCFNSTDYKMRFYFKPKITYKLSLVECTDSMGVNGVIEGGNYIDDNISIGWTMGKQQLFFVIKNRSNSSIKLLWDDMAYVKYKKTHRVIHRGVKFSQKEQEQPNTVVAKGASYDDILMPTDNVRYNEYSKAWEADDLDVMFYKSPDDPRNREMFEKSNFQILFPIIVNGKRVEYTFTLTASYVDFEQHFGDYYMSNKL